jgi:hypothetical protein
MPCRPWEEEQLDPAPEHPVTPTKPTRNDGASHADPDAEGRETESDREEDLGATKIRRPRHVLKYVVVKRWVTGDRAEMDEDQIRSELEAEMRHLMELSRQRKFYGHRTLDTDRAHWKLVGDHVDRRGIKYDVYRCPMRHRCQCKVSC